MTWTVYFEIYGRRMKTIINAPSASEAAAKVREKLIIHKVERIRDETPFDDLMRQFGMK
jgi:hypothetical protein